MLYVVDSERSVEEIEELFSEVVTKHKFGVLGVHNLKEKMNQKGIPFDRNCFIFEVCNPQQAKKILDGNMELSTALPCRISVYEEGGKTKIATIKPTSLVGLFQSQDLVAVAKDVEETLKTIIDELAKVPANH